jgi:hypothetical protein
MRLDDNLRADCCPTMVFFSKGQITECLKDKGMPNLRAIVGAYAIQMSPNRTKPVCGWLKLREMIFQI